MRTRNAAAVIFLCLSPTLLAARAAGEDDYLRGYVASWIENNVHAAAGRVAVEVRDGVVTLAGTVASPEEIDRIVAAVGSFRGVVRVVNRLEIESGTRRRRWRTWIEWLRPAPGRRTVRFPAGDLFSGPLADQKQPRFHTTWQRWHTASGQFDIASVGFGENFGLVRRPRGHEGDGWQVGISGAVFALFNMDSSSSDLLNADYYVGIPISYRSGVWSARLRLFHQSSHLGDEFLLQPQDFKELIGRQVALAHHDLAEAHLLPLAFEAPLLGQTLVDLYQRHVALVHRQVAEELGQAGREFSLFGVGPPVPAIAGFRLRHLDQPVQLYGRDELHFDQNIAQRSLLRGETLGFEGGVKFLAGDQIF